jgi:tetratricopeptide (TPR) repeat protein
VRIIINKTIVKISIIYLLSISAIPLLAEDRISEADSLFALRNEDFDVERLLADTTYVNQAIRIYRDVLDSTADSLKKGEALWKLLQSYYFKGQFGTVDEDIKQEIYDEGIDIGETYITEIPESVEAYMWLGINWARWAEVSGVLSAAMKGVAGKVKEYAEKTIALDEDYLDAGGYRLLGMLHLSVPHIPLFLTWPSNEEGVLNLEKAYNIAPRNLYNKMYLAMALHTEDQIERSKSLLLEIINTKEIIHDLAIDSFIKKEAENYLTNEF